ncbi:MAG: M23 family metallopeptidase [Oxalicibacterium faecigallinarum]|uniref:M23 family metallopeptidase n=1 Tax=Oxalicibacterium faecigallinarum TaxID=573741 RepID=UPI002807FE7F|nr:M23 family metallopeptidase [Oxalicibacterium faecigallinarum]MDQ7970736.1 M23 family metallopeptidase [Oxalicibacterium faecigallinarum]
MSQTTQNPDKPRASRWCKLLLWAALFGIGWIAWSYLPPITKTPFYVIKLSMMDAPLSLPIPVDGVTEKQLRDTWNASRSGGRVHEGIDIFAKRGTPVRSTTEGIVTSVGTNNLGGKVVWVLGPAGQRHYYAHLDDYADIKTGDRVVPGSLLGMVGNTGNARGTPPHLHYGIYKNGAFNPYPLLRPEAPKPGIQ